MEARMPRLAQKEQALLEARQQVAAVPKVKAPLVDTRTFWQSSYIHWRTQGLARVVISIHSVHGVRESQVD